MLLDYLIGRLFLHRQMTIVISSFSQVVGQLMIQSFSALQTSIKAAKECVDKRHSNSRCVASWLPHLADSTHIHLKGPDLPTILVKSIWYTLKMCFVFIIAPCSMIKAALLLKLGPLLHTMLLQGPTLWAHWPNIVWGGGGEGGGGGGKERWNCQKRPSVPLLLTRIVALLFTREHF